MKKSLLTLTASLLVFPVLVSAQTIQTMLTNLPVFFNTVIIPFLFGMAFLVFVINAVRFFIIEGSNEDGRKKAKSLAIYSITAFVFLVIFWGLVNMLVKTTGLDGRTAPVSDYYERANKLPSNCPPGSTGPC
ncbi:MAG: hypothetical protein R3B53_01565 [Candidatus Paceibacterota bacterium]